MLKIELRRIDQCRGAGSDVKESITNLYINVMSSLGDYDYQDDFSMHKRSQIQFYEDIKKYTDLESENLYNDIRWYSN